MAGMLRMGKQRPEIYQVTQPNPKQLTLKGTGNF